MKKYNLACFFVAALYIGIAVFIYVFFNGTDEKKDGQHLVEINVVMTQLKSWDTYKEPDLSGLTRIKAVSFLEAKDLNAKEKVQSFFGKINGMDRYVEPLWAGEEFKGLVRFDYETTYQWGKYIVCMESVILLSGFILLVGMLYIRIAVLGPFIRLSNMPYELSKGHFTMELEESKNRFFGKFVWGISMLRDNLKLARKNELKLEKEKKLLLLSISHDIKTPLNSIKLYSKALAEGVYKTEEKKWQAAEQIGVLSMEIEDFVRKIVKNSSEDILPIEVENTEFYLEEYVEMIRTAYGPKLRLSMTELAIGAYENRLLKGSMDSAFEVMENLMENALKYGDGRQVSIDFYEEDYCQLIQVSNSGNPVSSKEMPHLFDSFYRGSNAGSQEGNGLGLYICREMMHKMDGDIFAERKEDGMSFTLVFR